MSEADLMEAAIADLAELSERVDNLEVALEQIDDLTERVERLEERTDMLRLIEDADKLDADQRRAALWQHCVREAHAARTNQTVLAHADVERALHHPDVHRTTLYEDMRQVAAHTPEGVAEYTPARDAPSGNSELQVDLSIVDETVDASTLYEGGD